jgi:hypothetical protein
MAYASRAEGIPPVCIAFVIEAGKEPVVCIAFFIEGKGA